MEDNRASTDVGAFSVRRRRVQGPFSVIRGKLLTYLVLARFPWRFYFGLMGVLYIMVLGRTVYNAPLYNVPLLIVAFVIISLINAGGCAINDYFDREADVLSKPNRPIPAGNISPTGALEYGSDVRHWGCPRLLY